MSMQVLPDPRALDNAARRLEWQADDLRAQATRLAAASQGTHWASTGADAFRARTHVLCLRLHRCAADVDDAAAALRSHANTVRSRLAALAAGLDAMRTVEHGLATLTITAADGAAHQVIGLAHRGLAAIGLA